MTVSVIGEPANGSVNGTLTGTMVKGSLVLTNLRVTRAGTFTLKIVSGLLTTTITFTATSGGRQT